MVARQVDLSRCMCADWACFGIHEPGAPHVMSGQVITLDGGLAVVVW